MKSTHTGTVTQPPDLTCQRKEVSVPWLLMKTDKYWIAEGGLHFNVTTGKAMSDQYVQRLDITTIKEVRHGNNTPGS